MRDFVRESPFLRLSLALGIRSKRNQVRMKDYWKIDVTATLAEERQSLESVAKDAEIRGSINSNHEC